jgi:PIN domain nuclease of toxin-antitoxin system
LRLLLDTHSALWWLGRDRRLSVVAAQAIEAADSHVALSAVVPWEVSIKRASGKLTAPDAYLSLLLQGGVEPLPIALEHALAVAELPQHHRDPFDRMLVAQARVEGLAIVTGDPAFSAYDVPVIW